MLKMSQKQTQEQKQKQTLCRQFVNGAGNDILNVGQQLLNMRTISCPCVYPLKTPCSRMSEGDNCHFGFCEQHFNTAKGRELTALWNKTMEELGESDSDEDATDNVESDEVETEESTNDETESSEEVEDSDENADDDEEESSKEVEEPPPPVKKSRKIIQQPVAPVKKSKKTVPPPPQKKSVPNIEIVKPPKKVRQPASEESSVAEGSAKTKYVEQDEEESPAPLPALTFEKGKFGNYVNKEYGFVLRPRDKVVLGTENKTGGIIKLTPKQIQICKERNINYLE